MYQYAVYVIRATYQVLLHSTNYIMCQLSNLYAINYLPKQNFTPTQHRASKHRFEMWMRAKTVEAAVVLNSARPVDQGLSSITRPDNYAAARQGALASRCVKIENYLIRPLYHFKHVCDKAISREKIQYRWHLDWGILPDDQKINSKHMVHWRSIRK